MSHKTLIVGPAWVGDMVMAQATCKALKSLMPDTQIDVLAPAWSSALSQRMSEVHSSWVMPLGHGALGLKARYQLGRKLSHIYQRCYVLPNSFKSALVPFFAQIPERIGWLGEMRFGLLNKISYLNKQQYPLMVQRYLALVFPELQPDDVLRFRPALTVSFETVNQALTQFALSTDRPILVLCPGAEFGPAKRWPEPHYAKVANHYLALGWQVWILGSAKDKAVAHQIQNLSNDRCIDLSGCTSLAQVIDLMSLATVVVSNDSGLMHIAAALSRPLVALYGSSSADFTPPLSAQVQVLREKLACSPCFKRHCPLKHHACMQNLQPERIIEGVQELLA